VAARNPVIRPAVLTIELAVAHGLDAGASSLVLERVYPTRWISPKLNRAGDHIELPLDGFETAIYELYPIDEASEPLVAGVVFDVVSETERERVIQYHDASANAVLLNAGAVRSITQDGKTASAESLAFAADSADALATEPADDFAVALEEWDGSKATARCVVAPSITGATLAILLSPAPGCTAKKKPDLTVELDGAAVPAGAEPQEGRSQWWTVPLPVGRHETVLRVTPAAGDSAWAGSAQVWLVANQRGASREIGFELAKPPRTRSLPPLPWPAGEMRRNVMLGETPIAVNREKR